MSDTTAPGFLFPIEGLPPDDLFDRLLQAWIVGLTALPDNLVRPRWQPTPAPQPDQNVNWCAVGALRYDPDAGPWFDAPNEVAGTTALHRHEDIEALASFYGPAGAGYAGFVRDQARIGQNRDVLTAAGVELVGTGGVTLAADMVGQTWVRRADLPVTFRREVQRTYPIRSITPTPALIVNDPT